jgi:hypothetical protein
MGAFLWFGPVPNASRTSSAFAGRFLFQHECQQRMLDVANACRTFVCVSYTLPGIANAVRVLSQHTRTHIYTWFLLTRRTSLLLDRCSVWRCSTNLAGACTQAHCTSSTVQVPWSRPPKTCADVSNPSGPTPSNFCPENSSPMVVVAPGLHPTTFSS